MKKKKITYGVSGMMEYQTVVRVGKKNVSINFSDGSMSAMGTNPATYTTSNIIIQNAIEASADYKRGRITTVNVIELDEELQILRNAPQAAPVASKSEDAPETTTETAGGDENAVAMTQVEFSCNDDAKDYLEQNFGFIRSKLRNREEIVNAGKSHGVEILFV